MAHTLIVVESIWLMLQNVSKTLIYMYIYIYTMEALFLKGTNDGVFHLFTGEYTGFPVTS